MIFLNKYKWAIVATVFVIIILSFSFFYRYLPTLDKKEKKVILENYYLNTYDGFKYSGVALCNDGTIYTWDSVDEISFSKATTMDEKSSWIIDNGLLSNKKISRSKMKKINDYISNLDDESTTSILKSSTDGTITIRVWDYDDSKYYILKESGGFETLNDSKYSKKIIKFVEKYLNK